MFAAAQSYEEIQKQADASDQAFHSKVAQWRRESQSRADFSFLRQESENEEFLVLLRELAINKDAWDSFLKETLARKDPVEMDVLSVLAEQQENLAADAEGFCQQIGLSVEELRSKRTMARTIPDWRRVFLSGSVDATEAHAAAELRALQTASYISVEHERPYIRGGHGALAREHLLTAPETVMAVHKLMAAVPRPESRVALRRGEYNAYWADLEHTGSAAFAPYDVCSAAPSYARHDLCWRARVDDWTRIGGCKTTQPDISTEVFLSTEDPRALRARARGISKWCHDAALKQIQGR
eukprot:TRINITY_DN45058_c0_g1_i1.p1 TRINITY_DN45058_c0_g1~~TRINITY_DN45058_c0_g1_i1.p1  ORF type:complete len:297 (+),score=63.21 TRINITY_DN45058_c0_g1_i1:180-1070(+)